MPVSEDLEKQVNSTEEVDLTTENNTNDPAEPEKTNVDEAVDVALLKEQLEETNSRYLRLQADFSNFRRRTQKEKEDLLLSANQDLISKMLPVLDSLEKAEEMGDTGAVQIFKQLWDVLLKEGLEPIEAVGNPFDPNFHQALDQVESETYDSGIVVEEFRKGYSFRGTVIRPSMVRVAK